MSDIGFDLMMDNANRDNDAPPRHPMEGKAVQFMAALEKAISQHGIPNSFTPGELECEYGGPRASLTGLLLRHHRDLIDRCPRTGYTIDYGPGLGKCMRITLAATS